MLCSVGMNIAWSHRVIVVALGGVLSACVIEDPPFGGPAWEDDAVWTRISVSVGASYEDGGSATRENLAVELRAQVYRESTNYSDVIPSTVTVGPVGGAAVDVPSSYWEPGAVLAGWQPEYEVHVTVEDHGIDLVRRIRTPSFFALGLDPIAVGQPTTMTWTPRDELGVRIAATFQTPRQGSNVATYVLRYGENPDVGTAEIPATAFPRAAPYYVAVSRVTEVEETHADVRLDVSTHLQMSATRVAR